MQGIVCSPDKSSCTSRHIIGITSNARARNSTGLLSQQCSPFSLACISSPPFSIFDYFQNFLLHLFTMTTTSLCYVHAHESAQTVSPDTLRQPFQVYVSPSMMPEVCNKVAIEPHLEPITSEEMSCASQHPGWCLSTPRMVPLNTQDGAPQHPGWCLSTLRMVPLSTLGMVPLPALRIGQGWMWQQIAFGRVGSREHFLTLGFPTHSHLQISNPNCCLVTGSMRISRMHRYSTQRLCVRKVDS